MIDTGAIGVADVPEHAVYARVFEPYISAGHSDREAWAAVFTDEQRIANYRAVHGNRRGKRIQRQQGLGL